MSSTGCQSSRFIGREPGFSLVELMIAMTIGLLLIATIGYVFLGAKVSHDNLDALSRIQENARFAFEYMGADIRMAGYSGAPAQSVSQAVNVVATPTWDPNLKDLYGRPLFGYEQGTTVPGATPLTDTDALTVVHADNSNEYRLSAHTPASNSFALSFGTCPTSNLPQQAEIFVASDYTHSAVFQISNEPACSAGAMTVSYDTGTVTPGNAPSTLGTFHGDIGAMKLYPLKGATYYIANNPGNEPSLYRLQLGHTGTAATVTATEVVEGIADMQIEYGEDAEVETPTDRKEVTVYSPADSVANWSKVYSVRIELTLISRQDTNVATTGGPLTRTFTNTIAVRNRLL